MIHKRWLQKSQNLKFSDKWIRLYQDVVDRHNGIEGTYSILRTKKGVGVIPIHEDGNVYLVAQYRYAPDVFSLEIPKGAFASFGSSEMPIEAAKRELLEETGIRAQKWEELGIVNTLMGYSDDRVYLFLATELTMGESHPEECEEIEVVKYRIREIYSLINKGLTIAGESFRIYDATSIAGLMLVYEKLFRT